MINEVYNLHTCADNYVGPLRRLGRDSVFVYKQTQILIFTTVIFALYLTVLALLDKQLYLGIIIDSSSVGVEEISL